MKKVVVLGAGISGLSVGLELQKKFNVEIIEKNNYVGGLCASFRYKDSILDYGPHKLYSQLHKQCCLELETNLLRSTSTFLN